MFYLIDWMILVVGILLGIIVNLGFFFNLVRFSIDSFLEERFKIYLFVSFFRESKIYFIE